MSRRKRTPKPGDVVRITWWDIQTSTNEKLSGVGLPSAWCMGVVVEWDAPDPSGLNRTVLQHGAFNGPDDKCDYSEFPQGVITEWELLK